DVIRKVERALAKGQRSLVVAMATGTGKTKTAIGMLYRLLKAQRFRRALFLVDRTSLGDQSEDAFREMRVEGLKTFAECYAVKGLKPERLESKPKVHITTVQALVLQVHYNDELPRRGLSRRRHRARVERTRSSSNSRGRSGPRARRRADAPLPPAARASRER